MSFEDWKSMLFLRGLSFSMPLALILCHVQIRNRKTNPRIGFGVLTERIT